MQNRSLSITLPTPTMKETTKKTAKTIKPEDLGIRIVSKEQGLWEEIKENAQNELIKIEDNYFKSKTFNEAIAELATYKIQQIEEDNKEANK